jgi:hypothetical protein
MNNRTHSTASFSLVEVTLALGVAGFCLIAILGLLPAGLNTNQNSTRQTTANGILSSIVADLRATPVTSTTSNLFGIPMNNGRSTTLCCDGNGACSLTSSGGSEGGGDNDQGGGGNGSGNQCTNAIFLATVTFSGSGGGDDDQGDGGGSNSTTASFADVKVTWPYSAAAAAAAGGDNDQGDGGPSTQPAGGGIVETFAGLDRNTGSNGGNGGNGD